MMRLFIGVAPDRAARMALAETARLLRERTNGRFSDPDLYHITLAFLGDTAPDAVPAILDAMRHAASERRPFSISLGAVGCFGLILWRGIEPAGPVNELAQALRTALLAAKIQYDAKPFRAHITLARESRLPPEAGALSIPPARYPIHTLMLFESRRDGGALRYRPCGSVSLGGGL